MASTDCEYVVRLLGVCLGTIVSEFVPGGSLYNYLKMYQNDLTAKALLTFAVQIASVSYCLIRIHHSITAYVLYYLQIYLSVLYPKP